MLFAFLLTRAGLAHAALRFGPNEHEAIAIDEWMGASPSYTPRMQRALDFQGDDMATIFKGLQLDVGFTHQYMDVGYRILDPEHGEFWLNSCGALVDVEPMGEQMVVSMCHHIEDATFDVTAVATNAQARIRPVHRPPRAPSGRTPHCHWTVTIDPEAEPVVEQELSRRVGRSLLAKLETRVPAGRDEGGRDDYSGAFDPDFQFEVLGHGALLRALTEVVLQSHLLVRAMLLSVVDRHDEAAARELAVEQWIGANWIGSERLRAMLGAPVGIDGLRRVLPLHPAFPPDYAPLRIEPVDDARLRLSLPAECAALSEGDGASWFALLEEGEVRPLEALLHGVDPRATVTPAGALDLGRGRRPRARARDRARHRHALARGDVRGVQVLPPPTARGSTVVTSRWRSVVAATVLAGAALVGVAAPAVAGGAGKVAPRPSAGCDAPTPIAPGEEKVLTSFDGAERFYYRHVPTGYDGTRPLPLVLDLHGYSEGAEIHLVQSKLGPFGDEHGFITLTPHGLGTIPRWDTDLDGSDVQFIGALLDEAEATLCVDERRVYATGLSNGAFMSSALACAHADRFAAVAPVAGIRDIDGCDPARPVPVVAFHGTADEYVSFDGGLGPRVASLPNPDGSPRSPETGPTTTPAQLRPSIPDNVAAWAKRNHCKAKPIERAIADDVTLVRYRCPGQADVQLYRVEGGGHTWPGSEFSKAIEHITGPVTFSIDANDVMWRFFERHPLRSK